MAKVQAKAQRQRRKQHKRRRREAVPQIQIEGDVLVPRPAAARELGVATRTLSRMKPQSVLIGGFSYVALGKLRAQIAAGLSSSKRRARR
jgi:hypothetical protein